MKKLLLFIIALLMSFRNAKVFGGTAGIWANMQTKFNLHLAEEKSKTLDLKPYHYQYSA